MDFSYAEIFKNFISRKIKGYRKNGKARNEDTRKLQIVLPIR